MVRLKTRKGFTIIEVSLVLAISALIAVGMMNGVTTSIARQRYNDSVNDVVDYLRSAYSEAANVQNFRESDSESSTFCSISTMFDNYMLAYYDNSGKRVNRKDAASTTTGAGRTNCAVYGKLITFGERSPDDEKVIIADTIHSYDIIGRVYTDNLEATDDKNALLKVGADVATIAKINSTQCSLTPAGNYSSHQTQWGAQLQTTAANKNGQFNPFRGAIAIIRSPISGSIYSYLVDYHGGNNVDSPINIAYATANATPISAGANNCIDSSTSSVYSQYKEGFFTRILNGSLYSSGVDEITLCVGSNDITDGSRRRAIRISAEGNNSTAVKLLDLDATDEDGGTVCQ
jgi:prepilin-type N-terminal cleavage/methylation domain-containing protein